MWSDRTNYNVRAIHDMLEKGFSAQELSNLCTYAECPDLHPIPREFSPNDGPAGMVDKTIQYCQRRSLLPELLAEVKRANPRLYEHYARSLSRGVRGRDALSQPQEWKVKVFHFQNWGRTVEQDRIGERFSDYILNSLMKMQLDAKGIAEEPPIIPVRSATSAPNHDFSDYAELAPFIAVVGFVAERRRELGSIEATVRVSAIASARRIRPETLLVEELSFGDDQEEMRSAAEAVAGRIRQAILELDSEAFQA